MLKNNNQAAVRLLANRSMKSNRSRNFFVILAVILSTFMFTTVFSIGFSLAENMATMWLREQGSKASVFLAQPTEEQIGQIKKLKYLNEAGIRINIDWMDFGEERFLTLDYYDETEFEKNYLPAISDVTGTYPQKENELMLSQSALEELGIENPTIGMEVRLSLNGGEETFALSGYFCDYESFKNGMHAFASKRYMESKGLSVEKNGVVSMSAKPGWRVELLQELYEKVTLSEGQEFTGNIDYQSETSSMYFYIGCVVVIVGGIIVLSGYLLIYNIMYISVTKDIRFYGLLKTVGTSPTQIQKIVRFQSFYFCIIGIPIGILLGVFASFGAVPMAMGMYGGGERHTVMPSTVSFHPLIYIGTIFFAILTIVLSCRKPARMAGGISPVEALKYSGVALHDKKRKKQERKRKEKQQIRSKDGGKTYKMAWRNIFREKKRAFLVFTSLFVGTMAFLSLNAYFGSMKLENYVEYYLPDDFSIHTQSEDDQGDPDAKLFLELNEEISKIRGVTSVEMNRTYLASLEYDEELFKPFIEQDMKSFRPDDVQQICEGYESGEYTYDVRVIGVSAEMIERFNKKAYQKVDIERFKKGEVCMIGFCDREGADAMLGKNISIPLADGSGAYEMEVGSAGTNETMYGLNIGTYWYSMAAPSAIFVCQDVIDRLTDAPGADNIIVDCEEEAESYVSQRIKELTQNRSSISYVDSKSERSAEFRSSMMTMNILTGGMSSVLILIGLFNFINVMLTSIYTRRQELAVLESVGMTKKQIKQMLMFEGLYYAAITLGLILTLGTLIVLLVAYLAAKTADYAIFNYPTLPMAVISVLIFVICVAVPVIVYRMLSKLSVTRRLREAQ